MTEEWIEEDLDLLAEPGKATRVLDQRMIREPIRTLNPRRPLSLSPAATVADAVRVMREHRVGCVLVVEAERLVGIITETDFFLQPVHYPGAEGRLFELLGSLVGFDSLEEVAQETERRPVREVMSHPVATISEETPVAEIARTMLHDRRKRLPVVRDGKVVGMVSRHDFLKLMPAVRARSA